MNLSRERHLGRSGIGSVLKVKQMRRGLSAGFPGVRKPSSKPALGANPVCQRESAELRRLLVIVWKSRADFSALQAVWRRGGDSNPRYPLRYVRFRGGSFQPLTHLSALENYRPSGHTSETKVPRFARNDEITPNA